MSGATTFEELVRMENAKKMEDLERELKHLIRFVSIFPVRNAPGDKTKDKTPLVAHWKADATRDFRQIREWIRTFGADVNWAMPTGPTNNYWALDLDRKDGRDGVEFITKKLGALVTQTQTTRNGGIHKIFKMDPEQIPLRNRENVFGKESDGKTGVDIRGDGGYIVIAPSTGYKFTSLDFPHGCKVCPDNIYQLLVDEQTKVTKKKAGKHSLIPASELRDMLMTLPATDPYFESRDGWQEILRAVHSASGGSDSGMELFIEWSLQHPGPWEKDVEREIARDWNSYAASGETTAGTLFHHLKRLGLVVTGSVEVEDTYLFDRAIATPVVNSRGVMKPNSHNALELLRCTQVPGKKESNKRFEGLFVFDQFSQNILWTRSPDWDSATKKGGALKDTDVTMLRALFSKEYKVDFPKEIIRDAIAAYAYSRPTHAVKDYLKKLKWDGVERLSTWLIDSCGLEDDLYHREVGRKVLISAIARVMSPGAQVDTMMVLEGPQGCRKSTLAQVMGKHWFANPELNIRGLATGDTSAVTNTLGAWVIEMSEMKAISNADENMVKDFISTKADKVTLKYDKYAVEIPRQFIIVGTKNPYGEGRYIKDHTGARRYWPIRVAKNEEHPIDTEAVEVIMDQLYAEAYIAYHKGERWHMVGKALQMAKERQAARIVSNNRITDVSSYFENGPGQAKTRILVSDTLRAIWPMEKKMTQYHRDSLAAYLKDNGWEYRVSIRVDQKISSGWQHEDDKLKKRKQS